MSSSASKASIAKSSLPIPTTTKQVILAAVPTGLPKEANFEVREVELPALQSGQFLIRNHYFSPEPWVRMGAMDAKYVGKVLEGATVGEIIATTVPDRWPVGTFVKGFFGLGASEYCISDGKGSGGTDLIQIDPTAAPLSAALGVLGMPGATAWLAMRYRLDALKSGNVLLVSAAAGAVGSAVGQLANKKGIRVIGIAGGPAKCKRLREYGFDHAIDYKATPDLDAALREAAPDGIDAYFDNVGGAIRAAAIKALKPGGILCNCGAISQYNGPSEQVAADIDSKSLADKRIKETKIMVLDFKAEWPTCVQELTKLVKEGVLKHDETVMDGVENVGRAMISLFTGGNMGKMLVRFPIASK